MRNHPVAWMESPYGVIRANPLYRVIAPVTEAWSIPLYPHPPIDDTALLRQALEALEGRAVNRYMERLDETITALKDRLGEKT
jgi:hypothetical protein